MAPDPHAYLKWPRLIAFNIQGALAVTATGLAAKSIQNLKDDKAQLVRVARLVVPCASC